MTGEVWLQVAFVVVGGGGLLTGAIALAQVGKQNDKLVADTGKTEADAATVITDSALKLLEPLQTRIDEISDQLEKSEARATSLHAQLEESQSKVTRLDRQLRGALLEVAELRDENNRYRELHGPLPA